MAEKKKLTKVSSQDEASQKASDWEYPEINMDQAAEHLQQMEDADPKFKKWMEAGRQLARKVMKGMKFIFFL